MKKAAALIIALISVFSAALTVSAEKQSLPYSNYTYSEADSSVVLGPQSYIPEKTVYGNEIGTESFKNPSDIDADEDGNMYILDAGNNRIVVLTDSAELKSVISCVIDAAGEESALNGAQGITAAGDKIYVCDTENSRILVFDKNSGAYINKIGAPSSSALGESFIFKPTRVAVDDMGNLYVVSNGT